MTDLKARIGPKGYPGYHSRRPVDDEMVESTKDANNSSQPHVCQPLDKKPTLLSRLGPPQHRDFNEFPDIPDTLFSTPNTFSHNTVPKSAVVEPMVQPNQSDSANGTTNWLQSAAVKIEVGEPDLGVPNDDHDRTRPDVDIRNDGMDSNTFTRKRSRTPTSTFGFSHSAASRSSPTTSRGDLFPVGRGQAQQKKPIGRFSDEDAQRKATYTLPNLVQRNMRRRRSSSVDPPYTATSSKVSSESETAFVDAIRRVGRELGAREQHRPRYGYGGQRRPTGPEDAQSVTAPMHKNSTSYPISLSRQPPRQPKSMFPTPNRDLAHTNTRGSYERSNRDGGHYRLPSNHELEDSRRQFSSARADASPTFSSLSRRSRSPPRTYAMSPSSEHSAGRRTRDRDSWIQRSEPQNSRFSNHRRGPSDSFDRRRSSPHAYISRDEYPGRRPYGGSNWSTSSKITGSSTSTAMSANMTGSTSRLDLAPDIRGMADPLRPSQQSRPSRPPPSSAPLLSSLPPIQPTTNPQTEPLPSTSIPLREKKQILRTPHSLPVVPTLELAPILPSSASSRIDEMMAEERTILQSLDPGDVPKWVLKQNNETEVADPLNSGAMKSKPKSKPNSKSKFDNGQTTKVVTEEEREVTSMVDKMVMDSAVDAILASAAAAANAAAAAASSNIVPEQPSLGVSSPLPLPLPLLLPLRSPSPVDMDIDSNDGDVEITVPHSPVVVVSNGDTERNRGGGGQGLAGHGESDIHVDATANDASIGSMEISQDGLGDTLSMALENEKGEVHKASERTGTGSGSGSAIEEPTRLDEAVNGQIDEDDSEGQEESGLRLPCHRVPGLWFAQTVSSDVLDVFECKVEMDEATLLKWGLVNEERDQDTVTNMTPGRSSPSRLRLCICCFDRADVPTGYPFDPSSSIIASEGTTSGFHWTQPRKQTLKALEAIPQKWPPKGSLIVQLTRRRRRRSSSASSSASSLPLDDGLQDQDTTSRTWLPTDFDHPSKPIYIEDYLQKGTNIVRFIHLPMRTRTSASVGIQKPSPGPVQYVFVLRAFLEAGPPSARLAPLVRGQDVAEDDQGDIDHGLYIQSGSPLGLIAC